MGVGDRTLPSIPEPSCACSYSLDCLTNRILWWANAVTAGRRLRVLDLLLTAAARWAAAQGQGCSELHQRIARAYREAEQLEKVEGTTLGDDLARARRRR